MGSELTPVMGIRVILQKINWCQNRGPEQAWKDWLLLGSNLTDAGKLLVFMVGSQRSSHLMVPFSLLRVKDLGVGRLRRVKNI